MSKPYLFALMLLFFTVCGNAANNDNPPPNATIQISSAADVCQNSSGPIITFTGSNGTAPYTFTYTVTGSGAQTIPTTSGNSVTLNASTSTYGTRTYTLVSVTDATNTTTNIGTSVSFTVTQQPDATMGGTGAGTTFQGVPVFKVCSNTAATFNFTNTSSTPGINQNYTIDWGDSTPNFTGTTWSALTHPYNVGIYDLIYTIQGNNGCNVIKHYTVFVGSNPAVALGNPGNTDICSNQTLTFPITGTANNPAGTIYTVTFNDGSTPQVFNHPPPANVSHTFTVSSCGTTSSDGSNSYPNSFSANIVASNPCSTSSVGVVPIYVSAMPDSNFTLPPTACVNSNVCFNSTASGNQVLNGACSAPTQIWSISPATGFTLTGGSNLGNDFGFSDPNLWQAGSMNLCVNFSTVGTYTITLKIGNKCGIDVETKTICVTSPLSPQFNLTSSSGCAPFSVTATNTTNMSSACGTVSNSWTVSHSPGFCGSPISPIAAQTTPNASYNFTESGTYMITLTTTNSCGSTTTSQNVIVKKPPTASINAIGNLCGSGNINPLASVNSCAPSSSTLTYAWSFPGGTPATSSAANPGSIAYSTSGTHTISLIVSNECGNSATATQTFTVNAAPTITTSNSPQTICSGTSMAAIVLTSTIAGTTYNWTASASSGVTGFQASGNGGTIPSQIINYSGSGTGTLTYTVTPTASGCLGSPVQFQIQITPAPAITAQPQPQTVCQNATANPLTISINAGSATPSYQWYSNSINSTSGGTLLPGATNSNFTPPTSTTGTVYYYAIISLGSGGCASLTSQVAAVSVEPLPQITTQPLASQQICVGGSINTALSTTVSGGSGTPTYQWYSNTSSTNTGGTLISGATNSSYTPPVFSAAGTSYYYVVASFTGTGCGNLSSQTSQITVVNDPSIAVHPLASQTLCQGAAPQVLSVSANGGIGSFLYQWYSNSTNSATGGSIVSGATSSNFTPPTNSVGTIYYYCVVSQATAGCSVTSSASSVTVNTSPSVVNQPSASQVCLGGTPQTLSFTTANGIGTASYQWYSNTSNSLGGTTIPSATSPTYLPPTGVVGILWYYCEITFSGIAGSCAIIATQPTMVEVTPSAQISQQPTPSQSLCVGGGLSIPLSVSYSGGSGTPHYQWFVNTQNSTSGGTPVGGDSSTFSPSAFTSAGTYYYYVSVQLSASGCAPIVSDVASVIVVSDPMVTAQPIASQTICPNETAASLSVSVSGGLGSSYNYQWYVSNTATAGSGTPVVGATNPDYIPPTINTGTLYYYCVISQPSGTSCNAESAVAAVTVSSAPQIISQPQSQTLCSGDAISPLGISINNGVGAANYQWYSNTVNSNTGGNIVPGATGSSFIPDGTIVGTFYYYATVNYPALAGACASVTTAVAEIEIEQNPIISNASQTICSGNSFNVSPTSTGSDIVPPSTTYTWTSPLVSSAGSVTGASAQNLPQSSISQQLTNITTSPATVTYLVTPVAGNCPGQTFNIIVTVNPAISPNITLSDNLCFGADSASISTNVTGGIPFSTGQPYQFDWSGPNGFSSTTSTINNLEPGDYSVTISDAGGCPFTATYTISEPTQLVFVDTNENDVTCNGASNGAITIDIGGGTPGYTYSWTKNTTFYANAQNLSGLSPGTYEVTVSDTNNCGPIVMSFTITEPQPLSASISNQVNVECYGQNTGALSVNVSGGTVGSGYFFDWIGPNGFASSDQNITALYAGAYALIVTDANGCQYELNTVVTQSPEIIISYTATEITCYGANDADMAVQLSGGVAPYTFVWSNLSTSLNQTNLSAGDYTIAVTDALGCVQSLTINIPEAPIFTVAPIVTQISCHGANDGSIQLNLTGGISPVTLVWSDGSTAGLTRNGLSPGVYTATITDSKPCQIVRTFVITDPQPLTLSAQINNALDCSASNTGAIDLLVAGGTPPYSYAWSNGSTTEDISQLTNGNYAVTVTDSRGCSAIGQYSVVRPDPLAITVNTQTDFDCETRQVDVRFIAQVLGGVPPYQLQWSSGIVSGANNEFMETDDEGIVNLNATDAMGCTAQYTLNVEIPELGYIDFEPESFGSVTYGIFAIQDPITFTSNLTGDYESVIWDFGDGTFSTELNPVHTYVAADSYVVTQTVTYPFGCQYTKIITLLVEEGYFLTIPTAFTPNNDAVNDNYRPVSKRLENIKMDIYDSWGSMIFSETGDVLAGWNGTINSVPAENGNYYCKVTARTFYGRTITETKTFVLIK